MSQTGRQKPKNGGWKKDGYSGKGKSLRPFDVFRPGFLPVADRKFAINVIYMGLYRTQFDEQRRGDLLVCLAFRQQAKDYYLFRGQHSQRVLAGFQETPRFREWRCPLVGPKRR